MLNATQGEEKRNRESVGTITTLCILEETLFMSDIDKLKQKGYYIEYEEILNNVLYFCKQDVKKNEIADIKKVIAKTSKGISGRNLGSDEMFFLAIKSNLENTGYYSIEKDSFGNPVVMKKYNTDKNWWVKEAWKFAIGLIGGFILSLLVR